MCAWKYAYLPKRGVYEGILGKAEAWMGLCLVQIRMVFFFFLYSKSK